MLRACGAGPAPEPPEDRGHLASRYETPRPRKILALDGGGIRGALTLEVLAKLEDDLRARLGRGADFTLCEWFDYVGGTSTGAIIATGIARGMSVPAIRKFYHDSGKQMFDSASIFKRLKYQYDSEPLTKEMQRVYGDKTTLEPEHLQCLLLVVTNNLSTGSPWPISSNPLAKYNDAARDDCNLKLPLWKLVRASTAAPVYFPPEVVELGTREFVFVDGGVTPYNDSAFLMARMATEPKYRLEWKTGEDQLLVVSIGTGVATPEGPGAKKPVRNVLSTATSLPGELMFAMAVDQDTNCRIVGRCVHGAPLDREVGDLISRVDRANEIPLSTNLGKKFLYARYNADLSQESLDAMGLGDIKSEDVQALDAVDQVPNLVRIGTEVAKQLNLDDFGSFTQA